MSKVNRLRELDFLRGVAIILVLFRHQPLFSFTTRMGWIGVDLFFVLSGFLVSGLLFKEHKSYGSIDGTRFLIRRGFKIYPIYYLFYLVYLIPFFLNDQSIKLGKVVADLLFVQNYFSGWGYTYAASWSLAVEEHFYIGLVVVFYFLFKGEHLKGKVFNPNNSKTEKIIIWILVGVLILRVLSNYLLPQYEVKNFTMTHLRIDSLLFGVLIAYAYHYKRESFISHFIRLKNYLWIVVLLFLSFTPFINPVESIFVKTVGFTLVYLAFGILLCYFILIPTVNRWLDKILSKFVVDLVAKIGFCSYSIYIIHTFVIHMVKKIGISNHYLLFIIVAVASCGIGLLMTYLIENKVLDYRNRMFPSRKS